MACADPCTIIAMEVLVEKDQIAPVRVALKNLAVARDGPTAVRIAQENVGQTPRNLRSYLPQIGLRGRVRGAFDFEILAVIVVKFLEGFDEEIIHRKPDWSAPVRIAAKQSSRGLSGFVVDAIGISVHVNFVGMVFVVARKGAHAIRREEFRLVKHAVEHTLEMLA